jgi:hypothetical protein
MELRLLFVRRIKMVGFIVDNISIKDIRQSKPKKIYYSVNTCWWTHNPEHLCTRPQSELPCDPRGGMLMQTDDVEGFLSAAEQNPTHYGEWGLRAFMAAHHQNCQVGPKDNRKTCFEKWDDYNRLIGKQIIDLVTEDMS